MTVEENWLCQSILRKKLLKKYIWLFLKSFIFYIKRNIVEWERKLINVIFKIKKSGFSISKIHLLDFDRHEWYFIVETTKCPDTFVQDRDDALRKPANYEFNSLFKKNAFTGIVTHGLVKLRKIFLFLVHFFLSAYIVI